MGCRSRDGRGMRRHILLVVVWKGKLRGAFVRRRGTAQGVASGTATQNAAVCFLPLQYQYRSWPTLVQPWVWPERMCPCSAGHHDFCMQLGVCSWVYGCAHDGPMCRCPVMRGSSDGGVGVNHHVAVCFSIKCLFFSYGPCLHSRALRHCWLV